LGVAAKRDSSRPRLGFIGAGTTGSAFARCLAGAGYPVVAVASRTAASAERLAERPKGCRAVAEPQAVADVADLVFITTPDDAIASVAAQVQWRSGSWVVHVSGAESLDVLEPAHRLGAAVGSIHPLQTFADSEQAVASMPGSIFALEGEGPLLECLREMVLALRGHAVELRPCDKALYHAAAVLVSNYVVTLMDMATRLWQQFEADPDSAAEALLPLLQGTVDNLRRLGLPDALTGPIARGDLGTVRRHLVALEATAPDLLPAYRELGLRTIPVAEALGRKRASLGRSGGLDQERAEALRGLLAPEAVAAGTSPPRPRPGGAPYQAGNWRCQGQ
jgi:predicted short-subunit dehydrogenase-like oxidoreductase (DUF2520 family)